MSNVKRDVYCADALQWLSENKNHKIIITSLPDKEEIGMELKEWRQWIIDTSKLLQESLADDGIIFFYQTDRRFKGQIIDKKGLIGRYFNFMGYNMVLSKIVLKQKPNTTNLFRPTYTNLFAFSKKVKTGKATPDVIDSGKMLYKNAMGFNAVECCINFLKGKKINDVVVDPFCGMGSVLKIANHFGYDAIGVDILPSMVESSKNEY